MEYITSNMTKGLVTMVASTVKNGNDRLRREIGVSGTGFSVLAARVSSKVHLRSTEGKKFYCSIMKPDVSIKGRCTHSDMTGEVGGFQTPGVCLQAFPSFLPYPVLLHFSRGLWFLLLCSETCSETLATQAMPFCYFWINILFAVSVPHVDVTLNHGLISYSVMNI